jgi:hypothetical protein
MTTTTAEEIEQLRALGKDLAGALQGDWQPRTIAEAFSTPREGTVTLTMQRWINLDGMRSELLRGEMPAQIDDLAEAAAVFDLSIAEMDAAECLALASALQRSIHKAFSAALRMERPRVEGEAASDSEGDGFGDWAPLLAFLVVECGLGLPGALQTAVDQAFILLAAVRRNQGWQVAGTSYAYRDVTHA